VKYGLFYIWTFSISFYQIDEFANAKDQMLEDDDEGELQREDLPVRGGVVALAVAEAAISEKYL